MFITILLKMLKMKLPIGGQDQKNTNVQNIAALVGICDVLELPRVVIFRNAPDGSYVNPVERFINCFIYNSFLDRG